MGNDYSGSCLVSVPGVFTIYSPVIVLLIIMYTTVRILIAVDGISSEEVTAPVGIRYKGRRPQPS